MNMSAFVEAVAPYRWWILALGMSLLMCIFERWRKIATGIFWLLLFIMGVYYGLSSIFPH